MDHKQKIALAVVIIGSAAVGALTTKAIELRKAVKASEAKAEAMIALRDKLRAEQETDSVDLLYAFDEIARIGGITK